MRIEFNGVDFSEPQAQRLGGIVSLISEQMQLPIEVVEEVIVTSAETFGEVVRRFDSTGAYTNSRGLLAVGKTIPHRRTGQPTISSIILRDQFVGQLLDAMDTASGELDSWSAGHQAGLYTLAHELGHCVDHFRRPDHGDDGTFRNEKGQRVVAPNIANFCAYHHDILMSEFAACVFAGTFYTEKLREDEIRMNNEFVERQLHEVYRLTVHEPAELHKIQFEGVGLFWFILTQHAKQIGARIGNKMLPVRSPRDLWRIADVSDPMAAALERAETFMIEAWANYPAFPNGFRDGLSDCFHAIAKVHSFRFRDRTGLDGVWWNLLSQNIALRRLSPAAKATPPANPPA